MTGANSQTDAGARPVAGPLAGVRVLDLTRVLAGPFCTMILANLGADVIKVEDCEVGDQTRTHVPLVGDMSHYFLAINCNKRSIALDLKKPQGREALLRLVQDCDVVIENFRPGVMASLGLAPAELRKRNPRLIICAISGFGQTGSLRLHPAFDIVTQALSGVMSINGDATSGPLRLGLPMGDLGGGLWAAIGILSALNHRTGTGQELDVDVSMLEGLTAQLGYLSQLYFLSGESPGAVGNRHHSVTPYGCYDVSDGALVLAALNQKFYVQFCKAAGREDLLTDPRFSTPEGRGRHRDELDAIVSAILATRTRAEWSQLLAEADVPHAEVKSVGEALEQPVFAERGFVRSVQDPDLGELRVMGSPIRFGDAFGDAHYRMAPRHGEHTVDVLRAAGFSPTDIEQLVASGAAKAWVKAD